MGKPKSGGSTSLKGRLLFKGLSVCFILFACVPEIVTHLPAAGAVVSCDL